METGRIYALTDDLVTEASGGGITEETAGDVDKREFDFFLLGAHWRTRLKSMDISS